MLATTTGHPASWSFSPKIMSDLHHSRSIGTAHLYLSFTPPLITASELHTCTTQAKKHVAHITFVMVGLVTTQPSSWITLTITHHKTKHKGTFQPCIRICQEVGPMPNGIGGAALTSQHIEFFDVVDITVDAGRSALQKLDCPLPV
jgi:hypothetical protein